MVSDEIKEIDGKIQAALDELSQLRGGATILPLFLNKADITSKTVEDVFDDLRERFASIPKRERLDVILERENPPDAQMHARDGRERDKQALEY